jgi:exodeoxyribonuclease VII large subunit
MYTDQIEQMIYTVSQLNNDAKIMLEDTFSNIWVEGEISNFAAPASGHWYFSLKDQLAQVKCAMFRTNQRKLGFTPKDGMHILVKARVSLYTARGDYQLIAECMEERGEGKLRKAYELLKNKLEAAGLFAVENKKEIPLYPKCIGVVTSSTGAAIRDILTVLKRRHPSVPVIIYPSLVQGTTAASTIAQAIEIANRRQECDVLIVARGGGSLEDLWPFNEEIVAHAIFKSVIPIINAVGHEVDFTIADFVADLRAPTPSAAAELATPDMQEMVESLYQLKKQLYRLLKSKLQQSSQQLEWMQKHLAQQHPKRRLTEKMQQLDFLELTLTQHLSRKINQLQTKLQNAAATLQRATPAKKIARVDNQMQLIQQRLINLMNKQVNLKTDMLGQGAATLDALSPLATLKRGYAIATSKDGHIIHDSTAVKIGDKVQVRLHRGKLGCVVESN